MIEPTHRDGPTLARAREALTSHALGERRMPEFAADMALNLLTQAGFLIRERPDERGISVESFAYEAKGEPAIAPALPAFGLAADSREAMLERVSAWIAAKHSEVADLAEASTVLAVVASVEEMRAAADIFRVRAIRADGLADVIHEHVSRLLRDSNAAKVEERVPDPALGLPVEWDDA